MADRSLRVLLLLPTPPETHKVYHGYHQGVGSLSAVLKAAGHRTRLWTGSAAAGDALQAEVAAFDPDCAAISVTSDQMPMAEQWLERLRLAKPNLPTVAGGVHATVVPEEALSLPGVTAACVGEGEASMAELARRMAEGAPIQDTPGFCSRVDGQLVRNPAPPFVDLDGLPHPDRRLFDYQTILDRNRANVGAELMASRGCPYGCTYCANPALNAAQRGRGPIVRTRSVPNVLDEIARLRHDYDGIRLLGFHDDIFGTDRAWLQAWAEAYPSSVGLPYWCNGRVGVTGEQRIQLLADSGCIRIHFGVETGDETLRREVLGRNMSNEEIIETFGAVKRAGMKTCAFFMMGLPHETSESIEKTIALARTLRPDWSVVSLFHPFPGTALHKLCRREGWLRPHEVSSYYDAVSVIEHPWIDSETLLDYFGTFISRVYDKPTRRGAGKRAC